MRLTHIKLAGFKSFVDPTHIPVPGQLVGVVGPNGCGKSNVIDAVRWVLGESSARQLRGESMQDVIFNGAGERQPVGRASVELIFDNSLGKAAGPWSQYGEISVKRVLEREGESSYFINNQHVRRRDIADIFLGTGLGGRGYAIIEQGMISRIIEARPEDMRNFLEEAAGVSKYRERRRETELRLEDTRENLLRVEDIRNELGKQLEHLEGQAEKAGRYRELEQQLRRSQHLLWMTRKRDAVAQRARIQREVESISVEIEAQTAKLRAAEKQVEELRARHYAASDESHAAQGRLYEVNAEVSRLEQQIQHLRDTRARTERQLGSVRAQLAEQATVSESLQASRTAMEAELEAARATADQLQEELTKLREAVPALEAAYRAAQAALDDAGRELTRAGQQLEIERTRGDHSGKLLGQLAGRRARLEQEREALELPEPSELVRLDRELQDASQELALRREALEQCESALPEKEAAQSEAEAAAEALQQQLNQRDARLTALQALQEQVSRAGELEPWLDRHALKRNPHLWQALRIREGWEDALEAVLRERLNSIGVEDIDSVHGLLSDPPPGKVSFHRLGATATPAPAAPQGLERLAAYVTCTDARVAAVLDDWLRDVFVLPEGTNGIEIARGLTPGAMLVSSLGHIYTTTSVSFHATDSDVHGILSRQREIEALFEQRNRIDRELAAAREAAQACQAAVDEARGQVERLRREAGDLQELQHQLKVDHVRLTQLAERVSSRGSQIVREIEEIDAEEAREREQQAASSLRAEELAQALDGLRAAVERARQAHSEAQAALERQREQVRLGERQVQEADFQKRSCYQKLNELESSLQAASQTRERLQDEILRLEEELAGTDESLLQDELQRLLAARAGRETELAAARDALEAVDALLRETEQQRLGAEQALDPLRERASELRLKEQEARLAEENYAQQLQEAQADEEALRPLLEQGARASQLQSEIGRLNGEIAALGAVNLAALDEIGTARERKAYLDAQSQDLTEAVETLENAIRKIDRETRDRLQETFDSVNRHFGEMFPALFGGGEARLVMTGEEILDAGVQVIARPPGKRNVSIHLLSGGEKALTALALVFSMFQLNPAPFCLLDEVDAPLDDTNTERYCQLVRKMSSSTQFLFITHNKITMEMAQQLIGITMQELGVSRVVAVDIEEALRLREEAA